MKNLTCYQTNSPRVIANLGVGKGDCVAFFLPNIPQFIIGFYGALKVGAVLTAISPMHRERELEFQLSDSEAKVVLALDSLLPIVEAVWKKTQLKHVIVTNLEEYTTHPILGSQPGNNATVRSFREMLPKTAHDYPNVKIDSSEDLAALQYTGGTTGKSKAAMLTHLNLVSNALAFAAWIKGAEARETFLTALPLFHIYGLTTSLNVPVSLAAKMVLLPKFEPIKALEAIQRHRVTVFCGVPTMYQSLIANRELGNFDLTSIRVCISGASSLPLRSRKNSCKPQADCSRRATV